MKQYSFLNNVVLINGVALTGWDEGDDVIKIKRRKDIASDKVGAAGEMMLSVSADKSAEFTFRLLQTSSSNKFLNATAQLQQTGANLFIPIHVLFQDTRRNDLGIGSSGYIKNLPEIVRGAAGGSLEWVIVVENYEQVLGSS